MIEFFVDTSTRREWHTEVAPALYTDLSAEHIQPSINTLCLPRASDVRQGIEAASLSACELYKQTAYQQDNQPIDFYLQGDYETVSNKDIAFAGFDDQEFSLRWASFMAIQLSNLESEPLTVADFAALLQTGWFGALANECALTGNGLWQRVLAGADKTFGNVPLTHFMEKVPYDDNRHYWQVTEEASKQLRSGLRKKRSSGCPVARTSFAASDAAIADLKVYVPDFTDRWQANPKVAGADKIVFKQGPYTAIDDTLWQWGHYFQRVGQRYPHLAQTQRSRLGASLLLDES